MPLTLRKEHRLTVFENSILQNIFGPVRQKITEAEKKITSVSSKIILPA